jgi:hypothetical protein
MPTAQNAPFFPFERQLIAPELGRGEIVDEVDVNCWAAVEEVAMAASIWSSLYMICPSILGWFTVVPYKVFVPLA